MGIDAAMIDAGHAATAADIFGAGMLGPYGISQAAEITEEIGRASCRERVSFLV